MSFLLIKNNYKTSLRNVITRPLAYFMTFLKQVKHKSLLLNNNDHH